MGLLDSVFGGGGGDSGGVGFATIPQTPEAIAARKKLWELAQGKPPDVPRREIAPLQPMTEERKATRETAMEFIQPQDFMELPEVQGIIYEAVTKGDLLANRLGRGLQSAGALTSTGGRDVLGRAVTDVQKNLASSLAPFAMEERGRRERMIPMLEALGLTEEERKRVFEQAGMSAEYEQELAESKQLETYTIPLLKSIIGLQPGVQPYITGGAGSTGLEQLSGLIGPILTSMLSSGGGGGGDGGGGGGGTDWGNLAITAGSAKLMFMCIPEGTVIDTCDGSKKVEDIRAGDDVFDKNGNKVQVAMKYEYDEQPTNNRFIELTFDNGHSVIVCDMHRIDRVFAKDLKVGYKGLVSKRFVEMNKRSYDLMTSGTDGSYRSNGIPIDTMIPELNSLIRQKIGDGK